MNWEAINSYLDETQVTRETPVDECARQVAVQAHLGQTRWNGDAYITHPIRVAAGVAFHRRYGATDELGDGLIQRAVAYLHDAIEDTDLTWGDLRRFGFSETIIGAIDSVTKRKDECYCDFILRSKWNTIGRYVKCADIEDNLRDLDGKRNKTMRDKYELALWILKQ